MRCGGRLCVGTQRNPVFVVVCGQGVLCGDSLVMEQGQYPVFRLSTSVRCWNWQASFDLWRVKVEPHWGKNVKVQSNDADKARRLHEHRTRKWVADRRDSISSDQTRPQQTVIGRVPEIIPSSQVMCGCLFAAGVGAKYR
jgi:hypothetical protein